MKHEEELREKICEIVCIARWNREGTSLTAIFEMEEYIPVEDKLVNLIKETSLDNFTHAEIVQHLEDNY